ncbi:MAG: TylF/MycF/NovP-related O-methyltransferase [Spirochaetales bacterium]
MNDEQNALIRIENELKELRKQFPRRPYNLANMIYERAAKESLDYFYEKASSALILEDRFKVLEYALNTCMNNKPKDESLFLEFGVFEGESINFCADFLPKKTFYGFDSFEGLPELWDGKLPQKAFDLQGSMPAVRNNVRLVKGWFDKTLPDFLKDNPHDIAFLHIDCDLYSSTKTVFEQLHGRIKPHTIIVFDEYFNYPNWQKHEFKAFQEYVQAYNVTYNYLAFGLLDMAVEIISVG